MDEQFSQDGGEGDLGGFATTAQGFVEGLEKRVVQRGAEGGRGTVVPTV